MMKKRAIGFQNGATRAKAEPAKKNGLSKWTKKRKTNSMLVRASAASAGGKEQPTQRETKEGTEQTNAKLGRVDSPHELAAALHLVPRNPSLHLSPPGMVRLIAECRKNTTLVFLAGPKSRFLTYLY